MNKKFKCDNSNSQPSLMFVNVVLAAWITFQWRLCIVLHSGAFFLVTGSCSCQGSWARQQCSERRAGVALGAYLCSLSMHAFLLYVYRESDRLAARAHVIRRVLKGTTNMEKSVDTNHGDGRSCLFLFARWWYGNTNERCHRSGNDAVIAMDMEKNTHPE